MSGKEIGWKPYAPFHMSCQRTTPLRRSSRGPGCGTSRYCIPKPPPTSKSIIDFTPNPNRKHTRGKRGKITEGITDLQNEYLADRTGDDWHSKKVRSEKRTQEKLHTASQSSRRLRGFHGHDKTSRAEKMKVAVGGRYVSVDISASEPDRSHRERYARKTRGRSDQAGAAINRQEDYELAELAGTPFKYQLTDIICDYKIAMTLPKLSAEEFTNFVINSGSSPKNKNIRRIIEALLMRSGNTHPQPGPDCSRAMEFDTLNASTLSRLLIGLLLLEAGIHPNPGPPREIPQDDWSIVEHACPDVGRRIKGEHGVRGKVICSRCHEKLVNVNVKTLVGQHPKCSMTFSSYVPNSTDPVVTVSKEKQRECEPSCSGNCCNPVHEPHLVVDVTKCRMTPITSSFSTESSTPISNPCPSLPNPPKTPVLSDGTDPEPPPKFVNSGTQFGDFVDVDRVMRRDVFGVLRGSVLSLSDVTAVANAASKGVVSPLGLAPLFNLIGISIDRTVLVDAQQKFVDVPYARESRLASYRNVEEIKQDIQVVELSGTVRTRPVVNFISYAIRTSAIFAAGYLASSYFNKVLMKCTLPFLNNRVGYSYDLLCGNMLTPEPIVMSTIVRHLIPEWLTKVRRVVIGLCAVAHLASILDYLRCARSVRVRVTYCPHLVTSILTEYDRGTNPDVVRSTMRAKIRRLACLPLRDVDVATIYAGTEVVTSRLIEKESFFTEPTECVRQLW